MYKRKSAKRFIQFYNENGFEMVGGDSAYYFDNRKSNETIIKETIEKAKKQKEAYEQHPQRYCHQSKAFFDIRMGTFSRSSALTKRIPLPFNK